MTDTPTFDATDPAAENNARRDQERIAREDAETIRRLLSHRNGRAWFHRQLSVCNIFGTSYIPGGEDGRRATDFALGQENVGKQWMYAAIEAAPDLYMKMISEQKEEDGRIAEVRKKEERTRQGEEDIELSTQGFHLPPPAGYPGGPPLPKPEA